MNRTWAIITGEFPPVLGGVSDYTAQVARALAQRGDAVHVFTPRCEKRPFDAGVTMHELADRFGIKSLTRMHDAIDRLPAPREVLLQYVPHAFGWRAMNLPLCLWLGSRGRRRGDERITVMFHEVSFPIRADQALAYNALGAVNHAMAAMLGRAADRAIVTIPAWERQIRALGARCPIDVVPVPSNLPPCVDRCDARAARDRYVGEGDVLIGTFGSFARPVVPLLDDALPRIVSSDPRRTVLLIGRGSTEYRRRFAAQDRMVATGPLERGSTAAAIAACDLLVQPYPDGVSGRRSSTAAALALGVPVVSNAGRLTEPFWHCSGDAIALADSPSDIPAAVERLLSDRARMALMPAAAQRLYRARFALEHTIAVLRDRERHP